MKLAIGLITYNEDSYKYLPFFLPSLIQATDFLDENDCEICVFDNSSVDYIENRRFIENFNLVSFKESGLKNPIKYLSRGINLGFSRAYNILIKEALDGQATYFLMINPDTLLEPEAIKNLLDKLEGDSSLGSVAPKIRRWDFTGNIKTNTIDSAGIVLLPGLKFIDLGQGQDDGGQFDHSGILGPSGAAGLFRSSALTKIGILDSKTGRTAYLDESFFMYKEDCDLAYRLFLSGYRSELVSSSLIYHDRTAAASGQGFFKMIIDRYSKSRQVRIWSFRGQHLIFKKYWKKQSFVNRLLIMARVFSVFIFSLILEQFLLKEYRLVICDSKRLTNVK